MTEQAKFLPSVAGLIYDWLRFEDYLGNVSLIMCRLAAYTGPEIPLENIIVVPRHSLLEQSQSATEACPSSK